MKRALLPVAVACLLLIVGCGSDDNGGSDSASDTTQAPASSAGLPQADDPVQLDPADFTTTIDNPYFPLASGSKWTYLNADEKIVVTVTGRTKDIQGIKAMVVTDVVTARDGGGYVEVTQDWYAQDKDGNVWYMGEDTKEYEKGKVATTEGSWEHGVSGAYAGIIMPADPKPGVTYRQEYYKGEAEDRAKVRSVTAKGQVPYGQFTDAVETEDTSPLEPGAVELKYYAKDTGLVLRTNEDGGGREELVTFTKGDGGQ